MKIQKVCPPVVKERVPWATCPVSTTDRLSPNLWIKTELLWSLPNDSKVFKRLKEKLNSQLNSWQRVLSPNVTALGVWPGRWTLQNTWGWLKPQERSCWLLASISRWLGRGDVLRTIFWVCWIIRGRQPVLWEEAELAMVALHFSSLPAWLSSTVISASFDVLYSLKRRGGSLDGVSTPGSPAVVGRSGFLNKVILYLYSLSLWASNTSFMLSLHRYPVSSDFIFSPWRKKQLDNSSELGDRKEAQIAKCSASTSSIISKVGNKRRQGEWILPSFLSFDRCKFAVPGVCIRVGDR